MTNVRYRVGIDVGLNSVGLAAIQIDDSGSPIKVLVLESIIHDSGVDPTANKTAGTRKAVSGVARRMRRLYRRRNQRLTRLDDALRAEGLPIIDLEAVKDPRFPWKARSRLVEQRIDNKDEQLALLSVAIRHIARHRGWRNPYSTVESLLITEEPSSYFKTFIDHVSARPGASVQPSMTPAQIVVEALRSDLNKKLRGNGGLLEDKLHQSDHVLELRKIWDVQELPSDLFQTVVRAVFQAKSPKGSAAGRVGRDPLPGMRNKPRAPKASLAFQRFRIVSLVANLRIRSDSENGRSLTTQERMAVIEFLWGAKGDQATWDAVAEVLGIRRRDLLGLATLTVDGERAGGRPPINVTDERIRALGVKLVTAYWDEQDESGKEALIEVLSNGSGSGDGNADAEGRALEFIASLPEDVQGKTSEIKLPEGRAAYSAQSLRKMTRRMESSDDDLHAARMHEFGVESGWRPPADPIGTPVGNPAVDRVLKIVARWLAAVERNWGPPVSVNIEHTRDGLMSESQARKLDRENNRRAQERQESRDDLSQFLARHRTEPGLSHESDHVVPDHSDRGASARNLARYMAFTRQDGKCLYCGAPLVWPAFEMDHIIPRAGQGSTNTQTNLAAVCSPCNASKSKQVFAVWAATTTRPNVSASEAVVRAKQFFGTGPKSRDQRQFIDAVVGRLKRPEEDEPIDTRSMESVGWMANELRHRIEQHYAEMKADTSVGVFRGWLTSEARKASGIEDRIRLIGGRSGKNRLDRRHHAVDAATIAFLRPGIGQALVVRDNLRKQQQLVGRGEHEAPWKEHRGENAVLFQRWVGQMEDLAGLIQDALDQDRVPVFEFLRLGLGSSQGHEDIIRPLKWVPLTAPMPVALIDQAATPAQWVALTRAPGFDPKEGLPADPRRTIRVRGQTYGTGDNLPFFATKGVTGCIAVRGGYAEIGAAFHHARIYRCTQMLKSGKAKTFFAMMRVYQVDLIRHASEDLFGVDLPPQSMTMRAAEPRLREALNEGSAEMVGWIVQGDELLLDMTSQTSGQVGELLRDFPATHRWVVEGFFADAKVRLRPRMLANEGLEDWASDGSEKILGGQGWLPSVNVVFGECRATVVRRTILGVPRVEPSGGLPTSWTARSTSSGQ